MKKLFALLMALSLLMASGCGAKDNTPADGETNDSVVEQPQENNDTQDQENGGDQEQAEESTFTGTLGEVKDFMFEVTDDQGVCYAFAFEGEKPQGLADVKTGDKVTVTYTGEVSEVDPFEGTIISVAAAE